MALIGCSVELDVESEEANLAPVLTSPNTMTIKEGQSNLNYAASATDPEQDSISYSVSGADADAFEINADTGILNFKQAPSFDSPTDADNNNIYQLTLTASDGDKQTSHDLTITITQDITTPPSGDDNLVRIYSAEKTSVIQGATGIVYQIMANKPDGTTITYSIEGADADQFELNTATGELSFKTAPLFTAPTDINNDNNYQITLVSSDGSNVDKRPFTMSVTENTSALYLTDLTALNNECNKISLTWTDVANVEKYRVRRRVFGETVYTNIGDVNPQIESFIDTNPIKDEVLEYVVRPIQGGKAVDASNLVRITNYCDGIAPIDPDPIDPNDNGIRKTDSNYFHEIDGLVIMEIESTQSPLGLWTNQTSVNGYRGTGHIEFTGNQTSSGPATSPLEFTFKINQGGLYGIQMRAHKNIQPEVPSDHSNDGYVKLQGDYGEHPDAGDSHQQPAKLDLLQKNTKLFGGTSNGWGWTETLDPGGHDNKRKPFYDLVAGETYKLTVSGRSKYFNIDRIVFYKLDKYSKLEAQKTLGKPETVTPNDIGVPSANRTITAKTCPQPTSVTPLWQDKGRIAISSDGNEHDKDDWAATPMSLALLAAQNLQDKLAVYVYSDHHWGSNVKESDALAQMQESALKGAEHFGFDKSRFFEAATDLDASVNALVAEINKSTADDPLILIGAGPMDVIGRAIAAADQTKLTFVTTLSHSNWNNKHSDNPDSFEDHSGYTYEEIKTEFEPKGLTVVQIKDQNGGPGYDGMRADKAYFDWLKDTGDDDLEWLYSRQQAAIKGSEFDPSDSGMIIYMLNGIEDTDPCHAEALMTPLLPTN